MKAVQVVTTSGPESLEVRDLPEPTAGPGQVLVRVERVGISFPDLLLSRGEYQIRPEPPFTLGVDFAGVVLACPGGEFAPGQRVAGFGMGCASELYVAGVDSVFAVPDELSADQAAALPMNYLTADFALHHRAGLRAGETVLVHGAAGGVGTATLQVARGMGARTIAVVSTEEKADVARAAGADEVVLLDGFKDAVLELTDRRGVDVVLDVVGGDAFVDSLRCLAPGGRLMVVGFAAGQGIPELRVNRLLLANTDVRGVNWGGHLMTCGDPGFLRSQWLRVAPMVSAGVVAPVVGRSYRLEEFGQALLDLDGRRVLGKAVVEVA